MSAFKPVGQAAPFREVLPRSVVLPQPPRFSFGDFPADVASQYFNSLHISAIGIYAGTGFELCDGYTLHHDDQLVSAPELKIHPKHLMDIDPAREAGYRQRPRRRVSGTVANIISPGHAIYGHWLAEILPRLAVLTAGGEALDKLTFAVPVDTPKFGLDLLALCGVPQSQILVYGAEEVLCPDELLMPTLINNGVRYAPLLAEAVALFKRGVVKAGYSLAAQDGPARIFLARGGGNRRLINRDAIQAAAEAAGFTIIRPETMSLPEQVALFGQAREITGEYGSAFHNALFAPSGTVVCGLRGSKNHPGFLQTGMGEQLGQPTGYVFGQTGGGKPHDYTVAEADFADCLRIVFGPNANLSTRVRPATPKQEPPTFPPSTQPDAVPARRTLRDVLGKQGRMVRQAAAGLFLGMKK